jgi:hypothetical protein
MNLLKDIFLFHFHACTAWGKRYGLVEAARKVAVGDIWKVAAGGKEFNFLHEERQQRFHGMRPFGLLETLAQRVSPARADLLHPYSYQLPPEPADFDFLPIARSVYIKIAQQTGKKSCYFTTDACGIGLAYHMVQERDVRCVLDGCKYPVVLRPQNDEIGRYKLVTVSYVDGIMDGEFLRNHNSVRTEEFVIA